MIFVGTVLAEADMKTMITPLSCYYAAVRLILIRRLCGSAASCSILTRW